MLRHFHWQLRRLYTYMLTCLRRLGALICLNLVYSSSEFWKNQQPHLTSSQTSQSERSWCSALCAALRRVSTTKKLPNELGVSLDRVSQHMFSKYPLRRVCGAVEGQPSVTDQPPEQARQPEQRNEDKSEDGEQSSPHFHRRNPSQHRVLAWEIITQGVHSCHRLSFGKIDFWGNFYKQVCWVVEATPQTPFGKSSSYGAMRK